MKNPIRRLAATAAVAALLVGAGAGVAGASPPARPPAARCGSHTAGSTMLAVGATYRGRVGVWVVPPVCLPEFGPLEAVVVPWRGRETTTPIREISAPTWNAPSVFAEVPDPHSTGATILLLDGRYVVATTTAYFGAQGQVVNPPPLPSGG